MIYRTVDFTSDTSFVGAVDPAVALTSLLGEITSYPIIVFTPTGNTILRNGTDASGYTPSETETEIIYPATVPSITLGSEYPVLIMTDGDRSFVVKDPVPEPTLTVTLDGDGNPSLSWTNAYQVPTKVYRTEVYTSGDPVPSEYTLIAEVDGYNNSGPNTYVDSAITGFTSGNSVTYIVATEYGSSTEETVSVT